jgi:hypothetical protein
MWAWLHEALLWNEVKKQKLSAFLETINGLLERTPPTEGEFTRTRMTSSMSWSFHVTIRSSRFGESNT